MKPILSCIAALLLYGTMAAQQTVFTVEHSGSTSVYTNLDTAIQNAQSGDFIYLPGGIINFSGTISKSLNLVGAGFFADSTVATSQTIFPQTLNLTAGASNFSMTGVFVQGNVLISGCSNVLFSRCRLGTSKDNSVNIMEASGNININGCTAGTINQNNYPPAFYIQNSILYGPIYANAITIKHCILFEPANGSFNQLFYYGNSTGMNLNNSLLENNIIYSPYSTPSASMVVNTFNNNVFCNVSSIGPSTGQNNQFNVTVSNVFVTPGITYGSYNPANNFKLAAGSPAIGAGTGGTDCGIYGGATPFKDGAMPFNPHIRVAEIPSVTNPNGNLDVHFEVSAQDN